MTKDAKILDEIYRRVYAVSTPFADWDKLLENAKIDDDGKKLIPYLDYECEESVMEEILKEVLKKHKVPKWKHEAFKMSFYLGCSPKSKNNEK